MSSTGHRLVHSIRRWHYRIGVVAAVFFLLLVVTGVLLNHTDALKLDSRPVRNPLVLKWYGLKTAVPTSGYQIGDQYFVADLEKWVLGDRVIADKHGTPIGAVAVAGAVYVATKTSLVIFQPDGTLVDKIDESGLPGVPLRRLGSTDNQVVLATKSGSFVSQDGVAWSPFAAAQARWADAVDLPQINRQAMEPLFAPSIPVERLLLDLHSGRILGPMGPWVVDLVAIALLTLACSGVWIYWSMLRRRRGSRQ